ncbi:MAG: phosphoribosylamine--glycine ligase [Pseudomonadota bacterium]
MNLLLIGSGGREHALAWAISKSPLVDTLYVAPGNAGMASVAERTDLNISDHRAVSMFCAQKAIDLVVVGPEAPLAEGIADSLEASGILVFGPSKAAAQLETSKDFTKALCAQKNIPTAAYATYDEAAFAKERLASGDFPVVLKADGLAAGKGVVIAETLAEAEEAIDDLFSGLYDGDGAKVVAEDFLVGEEVSVFVLTDGTETVYFGSAQDHKRAHDGDKGPNTGGMGAYSPAPILTNALKTQVMDEIIAPTLDAMRERDTPFKGVLYAGLMLTETGPMLIEYNVRFGDPECQALMMRLDQDIVPVLKSVAEGKLRAADVRLQEQSALTVVVASKGYPGSYEKGVPLPSTDHLDSSAVTVFHAGTEVKDGALVSSGGRVLGVTALGHTIEDAQRRAYKAVDQIAWDGGFCRRDIGWRAVDRSD